jgi:hypothetical protein
MFVLINYLSNMFRHQFSGHVQEDYKFVQLVIYLAEVSHILGGTRWRSSLMHCATSREDTGSIPDDVIEIFH